MSKKLPPQVQAQADAAAAYDVSITPPVVDAPVVAVDSPVVVADPPVVTPVAPVTPPPDPQWEHKFRTLQGIFNTEIPKLQAEIREIRAKNEQLEKAHTAKPVEPPKGKKLVTDDDSKQFGDDMIDMARRVAQEEFDKKEEAYQRHIDKLSKELEATNGKVGKVAEETQRSSFDGFLSRLGARLPAWEQIQATDDCQNFLGTKVQGASYDWDAALKRAANNQDVEGVVEVFNVFFEKYPAHGPQKVSPIVENAQAELAKQVSPSKPRGGTPVVTPAAKKIYTSKEYADKSTEQYRLEKAGQRDKAAAIEQELNAALIEGRITA